LTRGTIYIYIYIKWWLHPLGWLEGGRTTTMAKKKKVKRNKKKIVRVLAKPPSFRRFGVAKPSQMAKKKKKKIKIKI